MSELQMLKDEMIPRKIVKFNKFVTVQFSSTFSLWGSLLTFLSELLKRPTTRSQGLSSSREEEKPCERGWNDR